jgi:hypothetical protein
VRRRSARGQTLRHFTSHEPPPLPARRDRSAPGRTLWYNGLAMIIGESVRRRFWKYVQKSPVCWTWVGTRRPDGYGVIGLGAKELGLIRAHVLSWILHGGVKPGRGRFVCHRCDNPPCVNPEHLFEGTSKDNYRDMRSKGRHSDPPRQFGDDNYRRKFPPFGEKNPAAKLTWSKVTRLRELFAEGWRVPDLSRKFGVSRGAVHKIVKGQSWVQR